MKGFWLGFRLYQTWLEINEVLKTYGHTQCVYDNHLYLERQTHYTWEQDKISIMAEYGKKEASGCLKSPSCEFIQCLVESAKPFKTEIISLALGSDIYPTIGSTIRMQIYHCYQQSYQYKNRIDVLRGLQKLTIIFIFTTRSRWNPQTYLPTQRAESCFANAPVGLSSFRSPESLRATYSWPEGPEWVGSRPQEHLKASREESACPDSFCRAADREPPLWARGSLDWTGFPSAAHPNCSIRLPEFPALTPDSPFYSLRSFSVTMWNNDGAETSHALQHSFQLKVPFTAKPGAVGSTPEHMKTGKSPQIVRGDGVYLVSYIQCTRGTHALH